MPDPSAAKPSRALLVVDVQNEYVDGKLRIEHPPIEASLANVGRAIDGARAAGIPVLAVQQDGKPDGPIFAHGSHGWQLHEVVASRRYEHLIAKTLPSAFAGTNLAEWLAERAIDTLAVVGYMTHNCVASTALEAMHRGFNVEFLADAAGSLPYVNDAGAASAEEIHRIFCVVLQSRFAAVVATNEWLAAIAGGRPLKGDSVYGSYLRART